VRVFNGQGLNLDFNGFNIGLDSQSSGTDFIFLSHAHTDHLIKRARSPVLTSELTAELALHRIGQSYDVISEFPDIQLVDSGHVVGGKSLIVRGDEVVFYTGDFCPHDRFFLKGLKSVKCDTLIVETTYGLPSYDFEHPKEVLSRARDVIEDDLAAGRNVVLWGYALGKAQVLTKLVEGFSDVSAHSSVRGINAICRNHGWDLPVTKAYSKDFKGVYITSSRKELNKFDSARVYSFTGWGANGVSDCFKLSDHAGFTDLLRFVKDCNPKRVFTHHGFSEEFASLLRTEGFDARAI